MKMALRKIHTKIAVIGGGTGGSIVTSQLVKYGIATPKDITVFEPCKYHFFQSFMSKVASGIIKYDSNNPMKEIERYSQPTSKILKGKASLVCDKVLQISPSSNSFTTVNKIYTYDMLILSTGLNTNFDACGLNSIKKDELPNVGSLYDLSTSLKMWKNTQDFKGGNAIFIQGPPPLKCTGATLQVCFLFEEYIRKKGIKANIKFFAAGDNIFPNPAYSKFFSSIFKQRGIEIICNSTLNSVTSTKATFKDKSGKLDTYDYDFMHAVPCFTQLEYLPSSLLNEKHLIDVNKYTLQHTKYPNIFALGDGSTIPVFKTAASIMYQSPVLVTNVGKLLKNDTNLAHYNGHAICPVITERGKGVFAETIYESQPWSRFLRNPVSQSRVYYMAEVYAMKSIYLNLAVNGHWYGTNLFCKPNLS